MIEFFFNDTSCSDLVEDTIPARVSLFAELVNDGFALGFAGIRFDKNLMEIPLGFGISFAQYFEKNSRDQAVRCVLSMAKYPYLESPEEDEFIIAKDFIVTKTDNHEVSVYGLAAAFLCESVGIGFNTPGWDGLLYSIVEKGGSEKSGSVMCVSQRAHFDEKAFVDWVEGHLTNLNIVLVKSKNIPLDKQKHLSKHHGIDTLDKFADRILGCPYVEEVINSIDRDSKAKSFIERLRDGNIIDIRLVKDGGFGLAVRTTAKNLFQLRKIAKILEQKYS